MFATIQPGCYLAGTGHRPDKIGGQETQVRSAIFRRLLHYKGMELRGVITGMALGFDTWWAEEALTLNLHVIAAVPFPNQEARWPEADKARYYAILPRCSTHFIQFRPPRDYAQAVDWLQQRNEWMVDRAWGVVACHNGTSGGTQNCINYAKGRGKRVDIFDPYAVRV